MIDEIEIPEVPISEKLIKGNRARARKLVKKAQAAKKKKKATKRKTAPKRKVKKTTERLQD